MIMRAGALELAIDDGVIVARGETPPAVAELVDGIASGALADHELAMLDGTEVRGPLPIKPAAGGRVAIDGHEVAVSDVRALADQVCRQRLGDPPWLFARPARSRRASEVSRANLADLEQQAVELDALDDPVVASVKRRFLLIELDHAGVLDDELAEDKRRWLRRWRLPTLVGYLEAAVEAWRYYHSELRAETTGDAPPPESLVGATLSIDWFRNYDVTPEGWSKDWWIGKHENHWILERERRPDMKPTGEYYARWGGTSARVLWRTDDGVHPSLLRAVFKS